MIAIGDAPLVQTPTDTSPPAGLYFMRPGSYVGGGVQAQKADRTRHSGQHNLVFLDLHVESLKTNQFCAKTDDQKRRWNNDHEPH